MKTAYEILNAESGWPDGLTPTEGEIKAYFLGWKMCNSDGSYPYAGSGDKYWKSRVDGSGLTDELPTTRATSFKPLQMIWKHLEDETFKLMVSDPIGPLGAANTAISAKAYHEDSWTGNGSTSSYTLSQEATGDYKVYVDGCEVTTGITKESTEFEFVAPIRQGGKIKAVYNETDSPILITFELLEPTGSLEAINYPTAFQITEEEDARSFVFENGITKKAVKARTFNVQISKLLKEDIENILKKYRGKTFRLKIENTRDSVTEYLSPCHIEAGSSKDWIEGSETLNIKAGDYYDNT